MKLLYKSDIRIWWRAGIMTGIAMIAGLAFFSFLLYQRVSTITNQPISLPAEDNAVSFSPTLLDDMKTFWEGREHGD